MAHPIFFKCIEEKYHKCTSCCQIYVRNGLIVRLNEPHTHELSLLFMSIGRVIFGCLFLSQNDCKYIRDDMWKVWEDFVFFLGSADLRPKCPMNPLAANRYPGFLDMKIAAFTLQ